MQVRLLGDPYSDYMRSLSPQSAPAQTGGFWSTVGNILSNRGVVEVKQKQTDKTMAYLLLGAAALGAVYVATKA